MHTLAETEDFDDSTAWMVTFSDLLTLLLTFFVMQLSMSTLDTQTIIENLKHLSGKEIITETAQKGALKQEEDAPLESDLKTLTTTESVDSLNREVSAENLTETGKISAQTLNQLIPGNQPDITLQQEPEGTRLLLGTSTFLSASDELSFDAAQTIGALGMFLKNRHAKITIAGHTDSDVIQTKRFPSNWELSSARAIAVVRQLIDAGVDPQTLSAVGYGDSKPIADNNTEEGRAKNRRVEVFIASSN